MAHGAGRRAPGFDYSRPGAYFVTVVVEGRRKILARVVGDASQPSPIGAVVQAAWRDTLAARPWIVEHRSVLMPDHWHSLVSWQRTPRDRDASLGRLVAQFKSVSLKQLREARLLSSWDKLWQTGFWDVVIRGEDHFRRVARYISENPLRAGGIYRMGAGG